MIGFTRNLKAVPEDLREPMVEFYGLVRKTEEPNFILGRRNWNKAAYFNWIDLWYFTRLFRISKPVTDDRDSVGKLAVRLHRARGAGTQRRRRR